MFLRSSLKFKKKMVDRYDEKQWKDVLKSSLITLILSISGLGILFLFRKPLDFYWFPYFLFFVLFVFSGSTLLLFKRS
ncbi:MAG: hypothetical protein HQ541_14530 [Mariniphaga sp.]|nr:hypothetical protein [Mariniphaga sp.]